jgi:hypothetical protein
VHVKRSCRTCISKFIVTTNFSRVSQ